MTSLQHFKNNFIGLDRLIDEMMLTPASFPPYNLIKNSDTDYIIELAVAGYSKPEISVHVDKNSLVVSGQKREDKSKYVFKGISSKSFERKFALADTVVIQKAELIDGLLKIHIHNDVSYKSSLKQIDIQ